MKNLSTYIALVALVISFLTFYYVRINKGIVEVTQPSQIYFVPGDGRFVSSTIVVTALMFSTADRGNYVEALYVCLEREDGIENFSDCRYEDHGMLRPGAFFVDKTGISTNFRFSAPGYGQWYLFLPGEYTLRMYIKCAHEREVQVKEMHLSMSEEVYREMRKRKKGICFVWSNSLGRYVAHAGSMRKNGVVSYACREME